MAFETGFVALTVGTLNADDILASRDMNTSELAR